MKRETVVGFERLKITCIIGVNPEEREISQEIFVDLRAGVDSDSIDYVYLAEICTTTAVDGKFHLLESYAEKVLEKISSQVLWAEIKVRKPKALPNAECSLVEMRIG